MDKRSDGLFVGIGCGVKQGDIAPFGRGAGSLFLPFLLAPFLDERLGESAQGLPRFPVVIRRLDIPDQGRRDVPDRLVKLPAVFPALRQRAGREPPQHQLEVPRIQGHPELGLGGEGDDVPRVFLGPSLQQRTVGRIGGQVTVFPEDMGPQDVIKFMIEAVLFTDRLDERLVQARLPDLRRDDEIVLQKDVALGFLRVRAEAELFDLLDKKPRHAQDVDVEDGVFGNGVVAHPEDDVAVGFPRRLHLFPRDPAQLVDGQGIAADPSVGGGDGLRSQGLCLGVEAPEAADRFIIQVVAGEDDFQWMLQGYFFSAGMAFSKAVMRGGRSSSI